MMTDRKAGTHTDRKTSSRQGDKTHSLVTKSMTGLSDPRVEGHDDRQKGRQTDRQSRRTDKQAGRQHSLFSDQEYDWNERPQREVAGKEGHNDRQKGRQADRKADSKAYRLRKTRQAGWQAGRQANKSTRYSTDGQI